MGSFPCTGNSIIELNYASFAGYYSQDIKLLSHSNYTKTGHEKTN